MDQWIKVGKVKDAHGIRGEIYVLVFSQETSWKNDLQSVQLCFSNGLKKEFPVVKSRAHKDGLVMTLDGITDRNQAEELAQADFFIQEDLLVSEPGEKIYLREILNFKVIDPQGKSLGEVVQFSSNGFQDLLVVENSIGQFEVPFVDAFIVEIVFEEKKLCLDLPEGLVETE